MVVVDEAALLWSCRLAAGCPRPARSLGLAYVHSPCLPTPTSFLHLCEKLYFCPFVITGLTNVTVFQVSLACLSY